MIKTISALILMLGFVSVGVVACQDARDPADFLKVQQGADQ